MTDDFLDKIYEAPDHDARQDIYGVWSGTYDDELKASGYATPERCAKALAQTLGDKSVPILDVGCGTGLSGLAFRSAGFEVVDGVDPSAEMLAEARAKGVYRSLTVIEPGTPLPTGYKAMAAVGVIGAGAAPIFVLDLMVDALESGGLITFSFNDHTLEEPDYTGRLEEYLESGALRSVFREHGPHIPSMDLGAIVYVLEKA